MNPWLLISLSLMWLICLVWIARWRRKERIRQSRRPGYLHALPPEEEELEEPRSLFEERRRRR